MNEGGWGMGDGGWGAGLWGMACCVGLVGAGGCGRMEAAEPGKTESVVAVARRVDAAFEASWREAGVEAAPAAPALTVVRRLALALLGTVPSLEEIRFFERRGEEGMGGWLERWLADRRMSDYWAERWARVWVGVEDGPFLIFRRHRLVDWVAEQFERNRPYDEVVRSLIEARGLWTTRPEVNFLTVTVDQNAEGAGPDEVRLAGRVARAFLGVRLDCVQCHRDYVKGQWRQADFHGLAAFFAPAAMSLTGVRDEPERGYEFRFQGRAEPERVEPAVPFEGALLPLEGAPRARLARWVTHAGNRAFARAGVNRVWALMFGRPLVEPVDDVPLVGPWPPGLEELAEDWVRHGYDLRRLIRAIAATRVFGLASVGGEKTVEEAAVAEARWASFPLSRLRSEQVAGAIVQAASLRTRDAQSHVLFRIAGYFQKKEFVERYGDLGEEELNAGVVTLMQRLQLMNGKLVQERSGSDLVVNASSRIAALAPDDRLAVETAYLCVLTRRPAEAERAYFEGVLAGKRGKERERAMEDLFWTLMNATEFSWNH